MGLILRSILWTIVCPGTVALLLPWALLGREPWIWPLSIQGAAGIVLFITGCAVLIWCIFAFAKFGKGTLSPVDPTQHLVVRGLYRYVRNPMYVGVMLILIGDLVSFPSRNMAFYVGCVWIAFHCFIVFVEEPGLKKKFGQEYAEYCDQVGRWIPGRPYRGAR